MSYLHDYLEYATANEAPEIFHVWGAYWCLSTVVGRRCWIPFADRFSYPNIYVMYVGGAGNGKSEALDRAKRIVLELGVEISASVETPEGLWRYMAGQPTAKPPIDSPVSRLQAGPTGAIEEVFPMAIVANEFVNFITHNPEGWISALNDIFDCGDYKYRTKNMGTDVLKNPYITLLGALTTEVATSLHKQNIIGTGMGRRTFFQFGERQWENPVPRPVFTEGQRAARIRAIDHLRRVEKTSGSFTMTPAAIEFHDAWYCENHKQVPKMTSNLKSWFGTKDARLMELAMLTSLSERLDLVIDVQHLELPLEYLKLLEADLPKVFGGVGRNELAAVAQRILDYILASTLPETKRSVKAKFFNECRPPTDFEDCITYLKESDLIWSLPVQVGSQPEELIGSPATMAQRVVALADASPATVPETLLARARQLLSNPEPPRAEVR